MEQTLTKNHPPGLEERFTRPPGWEWDQMRNVDGNILRFGYAYPEAVPPRGCVLILPGLSEFCEKYFETARDMLDRGLAVYVLDWQGQGLSDRHLPTTPHRRHSKGFENDVADVNELVTVHIKKHLTQIGGARSVPLILLAHSMGGNIGARYLHTHQGVFDCAALSAPMFGIKQFAHIPYSLSLALARALSPFHTSYIPGGQDWHESLRTRDVDKSIFSSDPVRERIHNRWCETRPGLQVGMVTYGWLHEALKSCQFLARENVLKSISIPTLIAIAGQDKLVDNRAARRAAGLIPHSTLFNLASARHEILMERDELRDQFLDAFDRHIGNYLTTHHNAYKHGAHPT